MCRYPYPVTDPTGIVARIPLERLVHMGDYFLYLVYPDGAYRVYTGEFPVCEDQPLVLVTLADRSDCLVLAADALPLLVEQEPQELDSNWGVGG